MNRNKKNQTGNQSGINIIQLTLDMLGLKCLEQVKVGRMEIEI